MNIVDMKINRIKNPLGFDLGNPSVSYNVIGSKGKIQKYAKIDVALDEKMNEIIFTTGKSESINNLSFVLPIKLSAYIRYYWRVTVYTEKEEEIISDINWFETAKLENNWEAKWITINKKIENLPKFKKNIKIEKEIKKARVYICGLGLYELEINNKKISDEYFAPGFNAYDQWIQYQTYDITENLKIGNNDIDVFMGKGWYKGKFGFGGGQEDTYGDKYLLLAELRIEYVDGSMQTILTDSSWKWTESEIIDGNIYDGEFLDMTFISKESFSVDEIDYGYEKLQARRSLPVKVKERFTPISIIKTFKGETVIDVGQNISGWLEFTINAPEGHEIYLQYGEVLQDGCFYRENLREAKAEFKYISNGTKLKVRPKFTFYGFRYVKIDNWYGELFLEDLEACVVYSDLEETGEIQTGDNLVNKLFSNIMWSQKDNFLEIPTDCPQRDERLGWTGDAQIFAGTACFNMDSYAFLSKYSYDVYQEQLKNNELIPMFVPSKETLWGGNSSGWADVATVLPWTLYNMYGDKKILEQQFESMKMWVEYIRKQDQESGNKKLWTTGFHFGDWLALDGEKKGDPKGGTDDYFIASIYYYYSTCILYKTAKILMKDDIYIEYKKLSEEIRKSIVEEYYTATGRLALKNQTAYVLSLFFNIAPQYKERTIKELVERLKIDDNHLKTGFIGTPYICRVLSDNGFNELAYTLLLNKDLPSWLYAVNMGATTVWERWNSIMPDGKMNPEGMNSLNHYAYGAVAEWMYRNMAGINEDAPGFKKAIIRPYYDWRIRNLSCYLNTASGKFESLWKIMDTGEILLEVTTPFDTETIIILNDANIEDIIINDVKLTNSNYEYKQINSNVEIKVLMGTYFISYMPIKDYIMTYNLNMNLETLFSNRKVKDIIVKYWPVMGEIGDISLFNQSPLEIKNNPNFYIDDLSLEKLNSELRKIVF